MKVYWAAEQKEGKKTVYKVRSIDDAKAIYTFDSIKEFKEHYEHRNAELIPPSDKEAKTEEALEYVLSLIHEAYEQKSREKEEKAKMQQEYDDLRNAYFESAKNDSNSFASCLRKEHDVMYSGVHVIRATLHQVEAYVDKKSSLGENLIRIVAWNTETGDVFEDFVDMKSKEFYGIPFSTNIEDLDCQDFRKESYKSVYFNVDEEKNLSSFQIDLKSLPNFSVYTSRFDDDNYYVSMSSGGIEEHEFDIYVDTLRLLERVIKHANAKNKIKEDE